MNLILSFIAKHMGYLWDGARFEIVGSQVTTHNGGDALLLAASDSIRLRFVRDRGQLFLDVQPIQGKSKEWFSIDLIRRFYRGKRETSAELDVGYATFMREYLDNIEADFREPSWESTHVELKKLKAIRAKEMFG